MSDLTRANGHCAHPRCPRRRDEEMVEAVRASREVFVRQMIAAPAMPPDLGKRGAVLGWPKGSVGWWNEKVQACDDVLASYECEGDRDAAATA